MQLRKMNENGRRNVRAPTARLMQTEHLEAAGDYKKEDRWREKHANVMMCETCGFEDARNRHFGLSGIT